MPYDFNPVVQSPGKGDKELQKELREGVQGKDVNRIPKRCKHPDTCPMAGGYVGAIHSQCRVFCGVVDLASAYD